MKKIKLLKVVAPLALVSTLAMVGCKGGLGSADTDNIDVTIDTRGAEISMWTGFGGGVNPTLEPLIEEFSAKTGITVHYESKGGYDNLQKAIDLATPTKDYANIAVGYPDHFAGYINSNIQLRLDGLIKNDSKREMTGKDEEGFEVDKDGIRKLDYSSFYSDYTPENETLEFKKDGSGYVLGLPFNKSSEVMVYNRQFFDWVKDQADIKDKIYVPKTWADVKSVGEEVIKYFNAKDVWGKMLYSNGNVYDKDPEITGVSIIFNGTKVENADKFRLISYDSTPNLFITLVRQFGGTYTEIDKSKTGVGYAAFNDAQYKDKTLEAMGMLRELAEKNIIGIPASFGESLYCSTPFKNYQSLLNVGSTAGVGNAIGSFPVGCAAIPQNGSAQGGAKFVISQGTNLALFNKGGDKEKVAAWKLMIYLSQQVNGEFCVGTKYFPSCKIATESKAYQDYLENSFGAAEKLAQDAAIINSYEYGNSSDGWTRFVDPGFQGSSAIREAAGVIPTQVLFPEEGLKTDQQILDAAYVKISDYVRK